jgi:hypothetical protein
MGEGKRGFTDRTKAPRLARTAVFERQHAIIYRGFESMVRYHLFPTPTEPAISHPIFRTTLVYEPARRMLKGRESPSRAKANNTAETRKRGYPASVEKRGVRRAINRSRSDTACRSRAPDSSLAAWRSYHSAIRQRLWVCGERSRSAHLRIFFKKPKAI